MKYKCNQCGKLYSHGCRRCDDVIRIAAYRFNLSGRRDVKLRSLGRHRVYTPHDRLLAYEVGCLMSAHIQAIYDDETP